MQRRALLAALALPLARPALAQPFPSRPVRVIVPFAPGGGIDLVSRPLAQQLSGLLGQPVVVENKPGAAGNIGMEYAATQPADGYTLLHANSGMLVTNPLLYRGLRTDPQRDLMPVGQVTTDPLLFIVPASLGIATLQDFVAYARARPGQVNFGSGGAGGITHLVGELFARRAGLQLTHVPYRGAAPALTDLVAGRIQLMFDTLGLVKSHLEAGAVRILATALPQRVAILPDIPTVAEAGVPGAEVTSWQAMVLPARTDPAIAASLTDALRRALASPELTRFYAQSGFVATFNPPEIVRARMAEERALWTEVIREAGIVLEG